MGIDLFSSSTPFTPPTTEDDRLSWLRLIRSRRVGPATFHRMIADHGTATAALDALPGVARAAAIDDYSPCPEGVARAEMAAARRVGARMICYGTPDYPPALADLPDAPPLLWAMGDLSLLARPMLAIVGARNASSLGLRMARRLAEGLGAQGICIVSGLARGIDAAAHDAALATGTVAVQAGGVDVIYPAENSTIAGAIAERGLRLSEHPPGMEPQARHFPARNRIISGVSLGVIVVEAASRSGSLITARNALDQGREVLAVPGHPVDARAAGCNQLIREGCTLIRHAEDVIEALGPLLDQAREEAATRAPPRPTSRDRGLADVAPPPHTLIEAALRNGVRGFARAGEAILQRVAADSPVMPPPQAGSDETGFPAPSGIAGSERRSAGASASRATGFGLTGPGTAGKPPVIPQGPPARSRNEIAQLHREILARLGPSPLAEDQLIRDLDLPAAQIAPELLALELDGEVLRQAGGLLSRRE